MLRYTGKRLLQSLVTVLIVVSIVFLLMRLLPTDYYFTEDDLNTLTEEQKTAQLAAAGLLDPPLVQLFNFFRQLARFDLGVSRRLQVGIPVATIIASRVGISMRLGLTALCFSLVIGVSYGILQARFKDRLVDHIGTAYTIFVNAVPHLVSYSLVLIFGSRLLHLPSLYSTRAPVRSAILPIVCLALGATANYMIWIRRYMVDELNKDYIKLATIKGMSTQSVMFRHVLKNAFVPMAQQLPSSVLHTIAGSILVEAFFSIPGMGPLLASSIGVYDTNVVQIVVMLYATLGILGVFLGDVLMTIIDPRIRIQAKGGVR